MSDDPDMKLETTEIHKDLEEGKANVIVIGRGHTDFDIVSALPFHQVSVQRIIPFKNVEKHILERNVDLVFVDTRLADSDIVSIVQWLCSLPEIPFIVVRSETNDESDRVLAVELGADECVSVSCSIREVRAKVRALLRRKSYSDRSKNPNTGTNKVWADSSVSCMGWTLHKNSRKLASPNGELIAVTNSEYAIIFALFSEPGAIKDRSSLRGHQVDGEDEYNERTINAFVSRLRRKLSEFGGQDLIESIRGQGYRINMR